MKLLYITVGEPSDGVRKKLLDKVHSMQRQQLDIQYCQVGGKLPSDEQVIHIPVSLRSVRWFDKIPLFWRLSVVLEQYLHYRSLQNYLRGVYFDSLIFRYPVADFFLWRFVRRYKSMIIFEHNTIEMKELELRRSNSWYYQYFYTGEKVFGRRVRAMAKALIGVTNEITTSQLATAGKDVPSTTISNGIDVLRIKKRNGFPFDGDTLNLVLLAGSAAPWHGVDIILDSLSGYHGEVKVTCFIAGDVSSDQKKRIAAMTNVIYLSHQKGAALDALIDKCHIGIGSLGFSDTFLHEACPLKVREYWARGLPFVIGYKDTDLESNQEMRPFFYSCELPLSIQELILFARNVYSIPDLSERMRSIALRQIHYDMKTRKYCTFINSLSK